MGSTGRETYGDYEYTLREDGTVEISKYIGEATEVEVPSVIDGKSVTSIEIPGSVTSIGRDVFSGCSSETSIEIPSSVTSIGYEAFSGCPKTMVVYTESGSYAENWATNEGFTVTLLDKDTPDNSTTTETPTTTEAPTTTETPVATEKPSATTPAKPGTVLTVTQSKCKVKVISNNTSSPTVEYVVTTDTKSKKVKVPDTVTVDNATYKVTAVADKAFSGNKKITAVTIGKNVTSIGKNAFKNCTSLKSVEIKSATLNKIGANAFSGDKNLTKITLKTTKLTSKSVGKNALKGTAKNLVIKVPKKKLSVYKKYFQGKGNKTVQVKK